MGVVAVDVDVSWWLVTGICTRALSSRAPNTSYSSSSAAQDSMLIDPLPRPDLKPQTSDSDLRPQTSLRASSSASSDAPFVYCLRIIAKDRKVDKE